MKKILSGKLLYLWIMVFVLLMFVGIWCVESKKKDSVTEESEVVTVSTGQSESESVEESDHMQGLEDREESLEEVAVKESETVEVFVPQPETVVSEETMMPESASGFQVVTIPEPSAATKDSAEVSPNSVKPGAIPTPEQTYAPEPTVDPEEQVTPKPTVAPKPEEDPMIHEHSWIFESWYQEPTCSNGGLVIEICVHCGETQITGGTPTGKHFYQVETQGDCCSEEVVVCVECNYREVREKDFDNHIDVEDGFCYGCGQNVN